MPVNQDCVLKRVPFQEELSVFCFVRCNADHRYFEMLLLHSEVQTDILFLHPQTLSNSPDQEKWINIRECDRTFCFLLQKQSYIHPVRCTTSCKSSSKFKSNFQQSYTRIFCSFKTGIIKTGREKWNLAGHILITSRTCSKYMSDKC